MSLFSGSKKKELTTGQCKALYLFLSFFIPFIIMIIALAGLEITPFGDNTLVITDANGFYISNLSYMARVFKGMEGITYSFEKGLGGNMMGYFNGVFVTPFSFLFALTDITNYATVYSFLSLLNLSLSGLAMYIFLADEYGHRRSNLIFSTSYALMGFQVANVFQAVFFCAPPVLPVMAVGLKRIFKGKNPWIYIFSIAYGLLTNAYFGFVLCVASVVFFCVGFWQQTGRDKNATKRLVISYSLSSIFGGLTATVLWLQGFLSMKGGRLDQTKIGDYSMWENMPFVEMGAKLFTGANSIAEEVNGLPNIFVGILPLLLMIIFFINKKEDKRNKMAAGILLSFYLLSFYLVAVNILMHGGTTPNWFNYRYSYVFSFIVLVIAARVWQSVEELGPEELKKSLSVLVIAVLIIFSKKYEFVQGGTMCLDFLILALMYGVWYMHKKDPVKNNLRSFEIAILELVCFNLLLNYSFCTHKLVESVWKYPLDKYTESVKYVDPLVQSVKTNGGGFFRMEIAEQRYGTCGNDPMFYGYRGVGHGGVERDFVREGLGLLGVPWFAQRNYYSGGVPTPTDSLLGVRFVITKSDLTEEKGYEKLASAGDLGLYNNPDALLPVFLTRQEVYYTKTDFENIFDNLNRIWKDVSGVEADVFDFEESVTFEAVNPVAEGVITSSEAKEKIARQSKDISGAGDGRSEESSAADSSASESDIAVDGKLGDRLCVVDTPPESKSYIAFSFVAEQDAPVYVYHRYALSETMGSAVPTIDFLGNHRKGETVRGYIPVSDGTIAKTFFDKVASELRVAYLRPDVLSEMSSLVNSNPVALSVERDSHLMGQYQSQEDSVLMFTIPYDRCWSLTIDDKKANIYKAAGVFMAADVPAGFHTFEMRYTPEGLKTGAILSAVFFILSLWYCISGTKLLSSKFSSETMGGRSDVESAGPASGEGTEKGSGESSGPGSTECEGAESEEASGPGSGESAGALQEEPSDREPGEMSESVSEEGS